MWSLKIRDLAAMACSIGLVAAECAEFIASTLPPSVSPQSEIQVEWSGMNGLQVNLTYTWLSSLASGNVITRGDIILNTSSTATTWLVPDHNEGLYQLILSSLPDCSVSSQDIFVAASLIYSSATSESTYTSSQTTSIASSLSSYATLTSSSSTTSTIYPTSTTSSAGAQQTSASPSPIPYNPGGLTGGQIAGIVIGAVGVCLLLIVASILLHRHQKYLQEKRMALRQPAMSTSYGKLETPSMFSSRPISYEMPTNTGHRSVSYELPAGTGPNDLPSSPFLGGSEHRC